MKIGSQITIPSFIMYIPLSKSYISGLSPFSLFHLNNPLYLLQPNHDSHSFNNFHGFLAFTNINGFLIFGLYII